MEIVSISENPTLAKSKKMMFGGFLGYIILSLFSIIFPFISIVTALAGLVSWLFL